MRNVGYYVGVCLLAVWAAGCAGGTGSAPPGAALDEPLPEYEPRQTQLTAEQQYLQQLLKKNGFSKKSTPPTIILVHKLNRKLTLYKGLTPLKSYSVVLGRDPLNDKLCQGDQCTPEGVYRVRAKYPHSKWAYFIWIDYPNDQNWIKFGRAKIAGRISESADIGGQVGIHGTEDEYKNLMGENWTRGCVSLRNKDLEEIYPLVTNDTLVVIQK